MSDQQNQQTESSGFDEIVGGLIATLRQARGLKQEDLAKRINDYGVPFHQQTVVKVEKGQRPLRAKEIAAIANALEVGVEVLFEPDPRLDAAELMRWLRPVRASLERVSEAAAAFVRDQHNLSVGLSVHDETEKTIGPLPGVAGLVSEAHELLGLRASLIASKAEDRERAYLGLDEED